MPKLKNLFSSLGNYFDKHISLGITLIYNIVVAVICIIAYLLIPILFNYPPGAINSKFDIEVSYISYTLQFSIITFIIVIASFLLLKMTLSDIDDWPHFINDNSEEATDKIRKIRVKCLNAPYIIYAGQIGIGLISIIIILLLTGSHPAIMIYKILILVFSFATLVALVSFIFSKRIFTKVLLNTAKNMKPDGIRIGIRGQIFIQILPIIISSVLFTSLVGYSRNANEKSTLVFNQYNKLLKQYFNADKIYDDNSIISEFKKFELHDVKNESRFIITPDKRVISLDNSILSDFFIKYALELADNYNGRVYDSYAIDVQGAITKVNGTSGEYIAGIKFIISSNDTILYFVSSFFVILFLIAFVLSYITNTLAGDISRVAENLMVIANGVETEFNKELPIISNNEIGDLVIAFNKIQQREIDNIRSIKENQVILLEQERLASLGQLIGGIAHNLKTPIMSISGGIEALKDLAVEYRDSIDDRSVTELDHKEIAKEMLSWLDRMKPYCSYMSDVISAVKGQAVQMNASTTVKFTVDELVKRVDLLMKHELKKYHCILNTESHIDRSTEIKGEVNNLVQVFDNIIINAMQAYEGQNGTIDLKIVRSGDNVEFTFRDYGKGIPKHVTDKLFKEMITTKGKNGTGLGLYMSYSTIKGRFGGNMSFTSKEGCGTTFFISIPSLTYSNQEAG